MQNIESLAQRFADRMGALLGPDFPKHVGLAVSGGGDSMSMLHLAAGWARIYGVQLWVVTIDHGLRDASAVEAAMVADECVSLGLPHNTLKWQGWDGSGNLQDEARKARLALISRWRGVCTHVLMGHTQDDQAETLLMRLARGSGVDGLSAMRDRRAVKLDAYPPFALPDGPPLSDSKSADWIVVRPMLTISRRDLRHFAKTLRIPFVDDPSNEDLQFARVRMRHLIGHEGLSIDKLSATARRMDRASNALAIRAHAVARDVLLPEPRLSGGIVLNRDCFAEVEEETQLRILAGALQYVANSNYRPRLDPLEKALDRLRSGGTSTLSGCVIIAQRDKVFISREPKAVAGLVCATGLESRWDGTWEFSGPNVVDCQIRAIGETGLSAISAEARAGLPRLALASIPAVWREDQMIACNALRFGPNYVAYQRRNHDNFPQSLLTH